MKKIILIIAVLVMSGCAVFKGNNIAPVTLKEIASDQVKPTLEYSINAERDYLGKGQQGSLGQSMVETEFTNVLQDSNYFSRISKVDATADIRLNVTFVNRASPAGLVPAVITGASMYTIPSWATDYFDVRAQVKSKDMSKEYSLTDSTKLVQWLPMILVFPLQNFSNVPEVRQNIYKELLSRMQADGFIPQ